MLISSWRCGHCLTGLSGNSCAQAALNTHCILRLSPVILLAVSAHQIRLCVTLISRDWLPADLPQVAWRWAKGSNGQVMLAECFWDWRTGGGRSCAESTGQSSKSCLLGLTEVPRAVPWKYATSLRAQLPPSSPLFSAVSFCPGPLVQTVGVVDHQFPRGWISTTSGDWEAFQAGRPKSRVGWRKL